MYENCFFIIFFLFCHLAFWCNQLGLGWHLQFFRFSCRNERVLSMRLMRQVQVAWCQHLIELNR
jgi:hypothetical protein